MPGVILGCKGSTFLDSEERALEVGEAATLLTSDELELAAEGDALVVVLELAGSVGSVWADWSEVDGAVDAGLESDSDTSDLRLDGGLVDEALVVGAAESGSTDVDAWRRGSRAP